MEYQQRKSPITMKLEAVKGDLDDLEAEISSITQELDSNEETSAKPLKNKLKSKTTPINSNSLNSNTNVKQNYHNTPDFKEKYNKKIPSKKIARTPDFNANSTLRIEDLMSSSSDDLAVPNSISTPGKASFHQTQSSRTSNKSNNSHISNQNSRNSFANYSSPSSLSQGVNNFSQQADEDSNRLYAQSVKILEKRTHSLFNNDPWFHYNDGENGNDSNNNENNFWPQQKNDDSDFYFPKQSTFTYNFKEQSSNKYKPITEMERINETQRKREKLAYQHQKDIERKIEEECTFKPILSSPVPVISAEDEEKIRIKKQKKIEENISQASSKIIRFIDPNSEKIAKKAKAKERSTFNLSDENNQASPSKQKKSMTRKQIKDSCERLSKPRSIISNSDEDLDIITNDDETKKKFCDPEVIERLYQSSMKPKRSSNSATTTSNFNENENQDNFEIESKKSFHSYMDSTSRKIIDRTSNKSRNSNDLFNDSVQVAEEKLKHQKEVQKYNEMHELNLYSFHPQINQTPPHFTVNNTNYSTLMKNSSVYSTSNTPKAKKIYYEAKSNQSSPMRKSFIMSPSPRKEKKKKQVSEDEINKILEEVDF
ncbi:hypothetical protein M9Y10_034828 [Tritrichomonas musculus]|uniref:Uncharacterized protein n=1 Tax=Tritrichomonas musculus TaxID=1915356 RepID=A0ABR2KG19_9EUKA